jgi:hypothetical protein
MGSASFIWSRSHWRNFTEPKRVHKKWKGQQTSFEDSVLIESTLVLLFVLRIALRFPYANPEPAVWALVVSNLSFNL